MPRNGAGTYSLPSNSWNPAVDNTTINAADWNATATDLANALTASLAADGQTITTARIAFAQGTSAFAGSPAGVSYSASNDPNTGLYFPATDQVGLAAGGVAVMTATSASVAFPLPVSFTGLSTLTNLTVTGNTTLGDAAGDTLTVVATGTFSGNQTFNGTATFTNTVTVPDASFANAKLANMATATIKGRVTAGSGAPEDLTGAQATTILVNFTGDSGSGGVKGLVPAPASGDAANVKYLMANGAWSNEMKAWGCFLGTGGSAVASRGLTCVKNSPSNFTFTLDTAIAGASYALFVVPSNSTGLILPAVTTKSSTGFVMQVLDGIGSGVDPEFINVQVLA